MSTLHRGHIFHLTGRPLVEDAAAALVEIPKGAILVDDDGVISWSGPYAKRPQGAAENSEVVDHGDSFILPGFVDTHIHYPQVNSIDAYGGVIVLLLAFESEGKAASVNRKNELQAQNL